MTDPRAELGSLAEHLPFGLGDVLVLRSGEEAWLAGASLLSEDAPIAVLFRAPSARVDRAIYLRANAPFEAAWLELLRVERGPIEPPSSLEEGGVLFSRARRLPVSVARIEDASFDLEGNAILGEYRALGERRLLRVATSEAIMLFLGRRLAHDDYDRFPGGPVSAP